MVLILLAGPALMLLHAALSIVILGFTNGRSPWRYPLVASIFGLLAIWSIKGSQLVRTIWCALFIPIVASHAVHMLDMGLLRKWDYEADGPLTPHIPTSASVVGPEDRKGSKNKSKRSMTNGRVAKSQRSATDSFSDRFRWGLDQSLNFRKIGTPYEVKNVHPVPGKFIGQTRRQWLLREGSLFLAAAAIMDLQSLAPPPPPEVIPYCEYPSLGFLTRILNRNWPSVDELAFRIPTALAACFFAMIVIRGLGKLPAIVLVGAGLSEYRDWQRPLYGSYRSTFTIRGFWGNFWHQMLRDPIYQVGSFITHRVIGIPHSATRGSWIVGIIKVGIIFLLSGLIHVTAELGMGVPLATSGSLFFFPIQMVGILIEDVVRKVFLREKNTNRLPEPESVPLWQRFIGHLWVVTWLSLTYSKCICGTIRVNDYEPILGFSLSPLLVKQLG